MHTYQGIVDCFFLLTWFMFDFSSACVFVLLCNIADSGFNNNIMNVVNTLMLRSEHNVILTNSYIFLCYYFKFYFIHRCNMELDYIFGLRMTKSIRYENVIFDDCLALNIYLFLNLFIYTYGNDMYLLMSILSLLYMNNKSMSNFVNLMSLHMKHNYFIKTLTSKYNYNVQKIKSNVMYKNISNIFYPIIKSIDYNVIYFKSNFINDIKIHFVTLLDENKYKKISPEAKKIILDNILDLPKFKNAVDEKNQHNYIMDYSDTESSDSTQTVDELNKEQPRKISISSSDSSESTISENDEQHKSPLMTSTLDKLNSHKSSDVDNSEEDKNMSPTGSITSRDELNELNKLFESTKGNYDIEDKLKLFSLAMDTYNKQCNNIYDNMLVSEADKHNISTDIDTLDKLGMMLQDVNISDVSEKDNIQIKKDN